MNGLPVTTCTPLTGVTVIEIGHSIAAPYAGVVLAQLGAEVIKIERPGEGDAARGWGPPFRDGVAVVFEAYNRDKVGMALDLKDATARASLRDLINERADVVIQNLKPGSVEQMGLSAAELTASKPSLIYCNISAFGSRGPLKDRPGYDPLMQAYAGLMASTGEPGQRPARIGFSVVDMGAGLWAALGIVAALAERQRTGRGGVVDTSLFETALAWMTMPLAVHLATGEVPLPQGSGVAQIAPYQLFETADGQLMVAAGNDNLFRRLCRVLETPEWAEDPRFITNADRVRHRHELVPMISARLRSASTNDWASRLDAEGVPNAPLRQLDAVAACAQTQATGMLQAIDDLTLVGLPLSFDGDRPTLRRAAPKLGNRI